MKHRQTKNKSAGDRLKNLQEFEWSQYFMQNLKTIHLLLDLKCLIYQ